VSFIEENSHLPVIQRPTYPPVGDLVHDLPMKRGTMSGPHVISIAPTYRRLVWQSVAAYDDQVGSESENYPLSTSADLQ
jgi:hypothetical protein